MTIDDKYRNHRLENLERCADLAPPGTYEDVKGVIAAMADTLDHFEEALRRHGLNVATDDRRRNLHVALFTYVAKCNPNAFGLISGEGFGEQHDRLAKRRA